MRQALHATSSLLVLAASATPAADVAQRVQLLPMGAFEARGHKLTLKLESIEHAREVIAQTKAFLGRTDMLVDYDHQVLYAVGPGAGGQAPAGGWIKPDSLTAEADGIWGDIVWTAAAAEDLRAKRYRYLSPTVVHDEAGRIIRLFNVSLVNFPAIEELAAAAAGKPEGEGMSFKTIALALALAETASEKDITGAISALQAKAKAQDHLAATAAALGLGKDATGEQILAAAAKSKAAAPDPSQYAPMSVVTELQDQLKALQDQGAESKALSAVTAAMEAGKVTPAQKDWALGYAKSDLAGFETYVAAAAVIVQPGQRKPAQGAPPAGGEPALTSEQKLAAAAIGVSEDEYLATLKAEAQESN